MNPDYSASLDFLEKWNSGGPWILTAISIDKKIVVTDTLQSKEDAQSWLDRYGSDRNIYFSVNPTKFPVSKKPMREDVLSLDWLHVDIDPRVGEDIDLEQQRALRLLQNPPDNIPAPTVIVFSGGGYQGFWKLLDPKEINGEEANYEDAKRYNQSLELAFGADNCHNVDRIMRLPGTINRPDAKKQKKGRKPALAKLVSWSDDNIYALKQFTPAPEVQISKTGFGNTNRVQVSGNIKRIDDVNDLPEKVSDLCKVVIVQGTDPDNPTRFPSRSEAIFFVCCELVRGGLDDDTIYSIITDPDFTISSSVLEKGSNAEKYAVRQIERARENAIDPKLQEMNELYAVATVGNKLRVIYEDWDPALKRHRLIKMTFEDFRNKTMNQKIQHGQDAQGNPRMVPVGKWWLEHEDRRQYNRIVFSPGQETPGYYNMWRGFAVEPQSGEDHLPFLEHIQDNVCDGDPNLFKYVAGWMARCVQDPGSPGQTSLVFRGDQGVGKGFVAKTFGKLFGRHYVHVSNASHLTGNFNAHLQDCIVLFADEAFYAGDKRHASTLKTLVTEDMIMVEPKGVDTEMAPNCLHIIMASNEDWVIPAGMNERRFCVLDVGDKQIQNARYFGKIADTLKRKGLHNLLHYLINYDLDTFDVRILPQTQALQDQKVQSYEPTHDWWYNKLRDGRLLPDDHGWEGEVVVEALINDFVEYTKLWNMSRRGSATKLGHFLRKACPGEQLNRVQSRESTTVNDVTIHRPYVYQFPSLQDLRSWWDTKFGGPYNWPAIEDEDSDLEKDPF